MRVTSQAALGWRNIPSLFEMCTINPEFHPAAMLAEMLSCKNIIDFPFSELC